LNKLKLSLATQLEEVKRICDEEARERSLLLNKFRNVEHELDGQRQQSKYFKSFGLS
jgi:myosin heavy chain 6/7